MNEERERLTKRICESEVERSRSRRRMRWRDEVEKYMIRLVELANLKSRDKGETNAHLELLDLLKQFLVPEKRMELCLGVAMTTRIKLVYRPSCRIRH